MGGIHVATCRLCLCLFLLLPERALAQDSRGTADEAKAMVAKAIAAFDTEGAARICGDDGAEQDIPRSRSLCLRLRQGQARRTWLRRERWSARNAGTLVDVQRQEIRRRIHRESDARRRLGRLCLARSDLGQGRREIELGGCATRTMFSEPASTSPRFVGEKKVWLQSAKQHSHWGSAWRRSPSRGRKLASRSS